MTRKAQGDAPKTTKPLTPSILAAVRDIVAEEGFEGATIRRVGARAGCSAGAVQKRFATRTDLLRAAFELVVADTVERMKAGDDIAGETLLARQRRAALETLPLDATRRAEGLVWTSYLLRAAVDDSLADLPQWLDAAVHEVLADDLRDAQSAGELRPDAEPDALADAVVALVDGVAIRMLYSPAETHDALVAALDAGLEALLRR